MSHERPSNLTTVGAILGESRALSNKHRLSWHQWRQVVGGRVAARSRPQYLDGTTLTVLVASSTWSQELSFLQPLILEGLAKQGVKVLALRFRVGNVDAPKQPRAVRRPAPAPLPESLSLSLAKVDDPVLRDAIASAAAYANPAPPPARAARPDPRRARRT